MLTEESTLSADLVASGVGRSVQASSDAHPGGRYTVKCTGADGRVKWSETFDNLVTAQGKTDNLDKYLSGVGFTATWYIGLISASGYTAGVLDADTAASHGGWAEEIAYSQPTRAAASFSAASAGSKSLATPAVFSMTGDTTVRGCFLASSSIKSGSAGVLYSAALFSGGNKIVQSSDTLNVSYSANMT